MGVDPAALHAADPNKMASLDAALLSLVAKVMENVEAARGITVLSPLLYRPVLSFLIWWSLTSWFVLASVG